MQKQSLSCLPNCGSGIKTLKRLFGYRVRGAQSQFYLLGDTATELDPILGQLDHCTVPLVLNAVHLPISPVQIRNKSAERNS